MKISMAIITLLLGSIGCGSKVGGTGDPSGTCTAGVDFDGDGYGLGCPAGLDCNDFDPTVSSNCCADGAAFTDCACDPSTDSELECFDSNPAFIGIGECASGVRTCDPGTSKWTTCAGQRLNDLEVCDEFDNDCDGQIDEGVMSACGNCVSGCEGGGLGDNPFPLPDEDPNVDADGVGLDPNGDLVLNSREADSRFLWIANDAEGTVSKIDTRTGREIARYPSVVHTFGRLVTAVDKNGSPISHGTVPVWNDNGGNSYADNRPSRTAIDHHADCWVANRAHDDDTNDQPSATKIWNDVDDCYDFNGNGTIETSSDVNGDGVISLVLGDGEFFVDDECIAVTVPVGTVAGRARALAIDAGRLDIDTGLPVPGDPGNAWVGMNGDKTFYRVTVAGTKAAPAVTAIRVPETGTLPNGHTPYGAAIDSKGIVWSTDGCCSAQPELIGINSADNSLVEDPSNLGVGDYVHGLAGGSGRYGMVVDLNDRVWIAAWESNELLRYDPATGAVVVVSISSWVDTAGDISTGQTTRTRGIALDAVGNIWAAIDENPVNTSTSKVVRVDADDPNGSMALMVDMGGSSPVGVGVDFDGHVWSVNQSTSNVSRLYIDPATNQPAAHPVTGNMVDTFPVGDRPYTYSDFTGLAARIVTNPLGEYSVPMQGCASGMPATWYSVNFDATTPMNTSVEVYVQVGDDLATLSGQPYFGPWTMSPADLQAAPGPVPDSVYLRLTIRLSSQDGETTPIVHGYDVQWACPGPGLE